MARIAVKVHPRAKRSAITGRLGEAWKLDLAAPPVDGKANDECVRFFAELAGVPRARVRIVTGRHGPDESGGNRGDGAGGSGAAAVRTICDIIGPVKVLLTALAFGSAMFAQTRGSSLMNPASLKEQAPATYKAKFTTTKGDFVVQVTRAWAPRGADRFYNLVKNGFFTDASFFRICPWLHCAIRNAGRPQGGRGLANANIPDDPLKHSNTKGTMVFANAGANTRTTQLFINLVDNTANWTPQAGFSPFGEVVSGMDVVEKLYSGYGEGSDMGGHGPTQGRIAAEGKPYLDKNFPKLDSIKTATIVP